MGAPEDAHKGAWGRPGEDAPKDPPGRDGEGTRGKSPWAIRVLDLAGPGSRDLPGEGLEELPDSISHRRAKVMFLTRHFYV